MPCTTVAPCLVLVTCNDLNIFGFKAYGIHFSKIQPWCAIQDIGRNCHLLNVLIFPLLFFRRLWARSLLMCAKYSIEKINWLCPCFNYKGHKNTSKDITTYQTQFYDMAKNLKHFFSLQHHIISWTKRHTGIFYAYELKLCWRENFCTYRFCQNT